MELGFETIGNATVIVHDRAPILATDPWLGGHACFGSLVLSHEVPREQREAIASCPFVFLSHTHEDHLHPASLAELRGRQVLLPDHVGGRMRHELESQGFPVTVLEERKWHRLSDRIRVLCISDYAQDAVLLIEVGGRLLIDLNDARDRGWGRLVRRTAEGYGRAILLAPCGRDERELCHVFHDDGRRLLPPAGPPELPGRSLARMARELGATHVVPFGGLRRYQRTDSVWANDHVAAASLAGIGFDSPGIRVLPPFVSYDATTDQHTAIEPVETTRVRCAPEAFGDRWGDRLEREDVERATAYFRAIEHLASKVDFVVLRVGAKENPIPLVSRRFERGFTIEAPRASLVAAIEGERLDELLLSGFTRVTLHGPWLDGLRVVGDVLAHVGTYADRGGAKTEAQLEEYFAAYRRRGRLEYLAHRVGALSRGLASDVGEGVRRAFRRLAS